ncbi:hypothetical protein JTE90_024383 [Oedothorax gibbosus]|uniref:Secreted protein n=1 Tax=Oedothorax gibbosus TaxID=931172 RepID=A0AAV6TR78_9ARAC|nr:hypothetical protein JTE90_024383 [Oedothorax gibbosus]
MYQLSTGKASLLLLLIWVATVKALAIGTQSFRISEEEFFNCTVYLGCIHPLETGKETRIREAYELCGPKNKIMCMETFLEISRLPMPNNEDVFWNKTIREICATKTEVEGKKNFNEQAQEIATWWSVSTG